MSSHKELRDAFIEGTLEGRNFSRHPFGDAKRIAWEHAAVLFPAPKIKVTRPRTADVTGLTYRFFDRKFQYQGIRAGEWVNSDTFSVEGAQLKMSLVWIKNARVIAALADLITNPTETVEVEA